MCERETNTSVILYPVSFEVKGLRMIVTCIDLSVILTTEI